MSAATIKVADVIRNCWKRYNREHSLPPHVAKSIRHILSCRTKALGGHIHECDQCGGEVPMYNSCQDRHCPTCQTSAKEKWLSKRRRELLPVQYFHCVFTLPHSLNNLVDANRKVMLSEMFTTVNWVLQSFAHDPQWRLEGTLGVLALLHTWSQRLRRHFHLHCIVPGGVWREETKEWIPCRSKWLFKKDSLAAAFRNRYIKRLRSLRKRNKLAYTGKAAELADDAIWEALLEKLTATKWIVYPKVAPAGAEKALEYLSRYTHKTAISNHRIKALNNGMVTYTWRDRSDDNTEQEDTISTEEFTKRFCYHILSKGFKKIRFCGWLSAHNRKKSLPAIREALKIKLPEPEPPQTLAEIILKQTGVDITLPALQQRTPTPHQQNNTEETSTTIMIHTATQNSFTENLLQAGTPPLCLIATIFMKTEKLPRYIYCKNQKILCFQAILFRRMSITRAIHTNSHDKKRYKIPIEIAANTAAPSNTLYI